MLYCELEAYGTDTTKWSVMCTRRLDAMTFGSVSSSFTVIGEFGVCTRGEKLRSLDPCVAEMLLFETDPDGLRKGSTQEQQIGQRPWVLWMYMLCSSLDTRGGGSVGRDTT
mmetsp:Transcript_59847/g.119831  ORF Transcript_59847/g.119831 Transcript_59847/m.119831 type:complete len:111 (-) Transcript_59847:44-376(-)